MSFLRCVFSRARSPVFRDVVVAVALGVGVGVGADVFDLAQTFRSQSEASGFSPQVVPRDPVSDAFIVSAAELGLAD